MKLTIRMLSFALLFLTLLFAAIFLGWRTTQHDRPVIARG